MQKLFDIKDKVIVITGGGGALGGALAKFLADQGAKLALIDCHLQCAEKIAREINRDALPLQCDVLATDQLLQAQEKINSELGKIDILINGAGGNRAQATTSPDLSFFNLPPDVVSDVFNLNFMGTFIPSQIFAQDMAETGSGVIINFSSMCAFQPLTRVPAYSAAKAAISNFTGWLAVHICCEYSKNIRVNAIAPGFFLTDQNQFLLTDQKTNELTSRGHSIISHTPMGRFGNPDDLAGVILWLISDASKFVTGIVIPIDGGFSAFSGV
ncbi:MAG: SDR family oxidoreductase [Planctomycetes bacterium]|nr:SDR family oxidoreductase [Planctomycetota bacterium]